MWATKPFCKSALINQKNKSKQNDIWLNKGTYFYLVRYQPACHWFYSFLSLSYKSRLYKPFLKQEERFSLWMHSLKRECWKFVNTLTFYFNLTFLCYLKWTKIFYFFENFIHVYCFEDKQMARKNILNGNCRWDDFMFFDYVWNWIFIIM